MFEKCITCNRMGESCVPNLMLLQFPNLKEWWSKRQKHLGWSNQTLADKSKVPVGTISRIKAGEEDCKYSTIRNILIALIGGTQDEFACTEQVEKELRNMEQLEQQAAKLSVAEAENERLRERLRQVDEHLRQIDEQHRKDIRIIKEEYKEQKKEDQEEIAFLREQLKAWQTHHKD